MNYHPLRKIKIIAILFVFLIIISASIYGSILYSVLKKENPPSFIKTADNKLYGYSVYEQQGDFSLWFPSIKGVDSTKKVVGVFYEGNLIYKNEYSCFSSKIFNIFTAEQLEAYQKTEFDGEKPIIYSAL